MERSPERIKYHYEVEKELAAKLRDASKQDRNRLYGEVYDELFTRVDDHPQLEFKRNTESRNLELKWQTELIQKIWDGNGSFLEIGAGDCKLSREISEFATQVYAYDVSEEMAKGLNPPSNFELTIGNGIDFPLDDYSIDLAYSNQLMEHLHPDDAEDQLQNIFKVLKQGGKYFCITPNQISGPHDVSRDFDEVATGFHLKEYTNRELNSLFRRVGFTTVQAIIPVKGIRIKLPILFYLFIESSIAQIAKVFPLKRTALVYRFLGIYMIGTK